MIGTRFSKPLSAKDKEKYFQAANWANLNSAKIVELDSYYEVQRCEYPSIDELKYTKLSEINGKYEVATSSLVSTYPDTELLTFDKQEKEAREWKADNSVETPFLDGLAKARGIDKAELVDRVIAKADAFETAVATLTGLRQKYKDQLALAKTAEDIAAIVPEYSV